MLIVLNAPVKTLAKMDGEFPSHPASPDGGRHREGTTTEPRFAAFPSNACCEVFDLERAQTRYAESWISRNSARDQDQAHKDPFVVPDQER